MENMKQIERIIRSINMDANATEEQKQDAIKALCNVIDAAQNAIKMILLK